jgi:hypothetical protein
MVALGKADYENRDDESGQRQGDHNIPSRHHEHEDSRVFGADLIHAWGMVCF